MLGLQALVDLEVFAYTDPTSRPRVPDWRGSDIGWAGWSMAVPDFDATLARLGATGVTPLTEPIGHAGLRRVAFRDPEIGTIVELLEDGDALPGGIRSHHYS